MDNKVESWTNKNPFCLSSLNANDSNLNVFPFVLARNMYKNSSSSSGSSGSRSSRCLVGVICVCLTQQFQTFHKVMMCIGRSYRLCKFIACSREWMVQALNAMVINQYSSSINTWSKWWIASVFVFLLLLLLLQTSQIKWKTSFNLIGLPSYSEQNLFSGAFFGMVLQVSNKLYIGEFFIWMERETLTTDLLRPTGKWIIAS